MEMTYRVKLKFLENLYDFYKLLKLKGVECNIKTLRDNLFIRKYDITIIYSIENDKIMKRLFEDRIKYTH